jgi:tRNA-splicing ligase RtcB
MQTLHHGKVRAWVDGVEFEPEARQQVANIAALSFVEGVAVMPDVHLGIGATVGSVIATHGAVVPAAVGVDIGCGMAAVPLGIRAEQLPDNLRDLRTAIEAAVPHGRTHHGGPGDRGAWHRVPKPAAAAFDALAADHEALIRKHPRTATRTHPAHHMGTLGTGNHFIELCLDETNAVWLVLHSGSRGIGNRIGTYFIERARGEMERSRVALTDPDLAYLPEGHELFRDYLEAVHWAQDYARANRDTMLRAIVAALAKILPLQVQEPIDCHHNYVERESFGGRELWVTRKGAVRARRGDRGVIPDPWGPVVHRTRPRKRSVVLLVQPWSRPALVAQCRAATVHGRRPHPSRRLASSVARTPT